MQRQRRRTLLHGLFLSLLARCERVPPFGARLARAVERWALAPHMATYFDAAFYLRNNADVAETGRDPARHWIDHGAREGRDPHPLFDVTHYRAQFARYPGGVNALLHFLLVGRRQRVSPTRWFSYEVYLTANTDVMPEKIEPFEHFVRFGVRENRRSGDLFEPRQGGSGPNLLLRYLEGTMGSRVLAPPEAAPGGGPANGPTTPGRDRATGPDASPLEARERRHAERMEALLALPARRGREALVDVIVPAYRNRRLTLECLEAALLSPSRTPHEIVVIDDCTPERGLAADLDALAGAGLITLLRNDANRGFVRSANRGMALHPARDVVLLNSDAVVYHDWLDRLRAAALAHPRTGTATPLTNRGTICSYPVLGHDNPIPPDITAPALDGAAARANGGMRVEIPTAVGFCMYARRAMLDDAGPFDETVFGTGYGEENDLCRRARTLGWHDVAATDVFVRHYGSMSFGSTRFERMREAGRVIAERYPGYDREVQRFVAEDPLRPHRARIDRARLMRPRGRRNALMITHRRGGGTEQNVRERTASLLRDGWSVYCLTGDPGDARRVRVLPAGVPSLPNLEPFALGGPGSGALTGMLRELEIERAEIHSLADLGARAPALVAGLLRRARIGWRFVVHDYSAICPRIHLLDEYGTYCGEPAPPGCNRCLARRGSDFGERRIGAWRARYGALMRDADCVEVPDEDVAVRFRRHFPDAHVVVEPHERVRPAPHLPRVRAPGAPLRVGTLGAISAIKGLQVLRRCARAARRRALPLRHVVVGYTANDGASRKSGLEVTGAYTNDGVLDAVAAARLDAIFLASTIPETFSYTLSIAFRTGLPVVAFDIGAVASRLRAANGPHLLLPLSMADDPNAINARILEWLGHGEPAAPGPWYRRVLGATGAINPPG